MEKLKRVPGPQANAARPGAVDRERASAAVLELLRAFGFDPARDPDLAHTAQLVTEAYADVLLAGYREDPAEILAGGVAAASSELIAVRDIETAITCPHHLMPATGVVHVAYAPGDRVLGLGALGRLVECFARRLTLQETLAQSVADALCAHAGARGAACIAELAPTCLTARADNCRAARAVAIATAGELRPGKPLHAAAIAALLPARGAERAP